MCIDVGRRDVSDAAEANILCLAADGLAGDRLPVLPVAADIGSVAACMLSRAAAFDCHIMSSTTETGSHDDLGAVEGCIKRFQLGDEIIIDLKIMLPAALAAELLRIEVRRKLRIIGIAVGFNHRYHPFCRSVSAAPRSHFSVRADTECP